MRQYAVEWQMTTWHTIIDSVLAESESEAIKKATDYRGNPPTGDIKVREIK